MWDDVGNTMVTVEKGRAEHPVPSRRWERAEGVDELHASADIPDAPVKIERSRGVPLFRG